MMLMVKSHCMNGTLMGMEYLSGHRPRMASLLTFTVILEFMQLSSVSPIMMVFQHLIRV
jgi:hypothetical protein